MGLVKLGALAVGASLLVKSIENVNKKREQRTATRQKGDAIYQPGDGAFQESGYQTSQQHSSCRCHHVPSSEYQNGLTSNGYLQHSSFDEPPPAWSAPEKR